jgi:hypothetical protein
VCWVCLHLRLSLSLWRGSQVVHVYTFNDGILITRRGKAGAVAGKSGSGAGSGTGTPVTAQRLSADQFLHIRDVAPVSMRDSDGARAESE